MLFTSLIISHFINLSKKYKKQPGTQPRLPQQHQLTVFIIYPTKCGSLNYPGPACLLPLHMIADLNSAQIPDIETCEKFVRRWHFPRNYLAPGLGNQFGDSWNIPPGHQGKYLSKIAYISAAFAEQAYLKHLIDFDLDKR